MQVLVRSEIREVAETAASLVIARLQANPDAVIGLAAGMTQEPILAALAEASEAGRVSFAPTTFFSLDEYCGLAADDPLSFRAQLERSFFGRIRAVPHRIHALDGAASDPETEASRYERDIAACGGIDLQLLGIGTNGHIAFNEPGSSHRSRTRVVALAEETRTRLASSWPRGTPLPTHGITLGIATILESREVVLAATGFEKADAVRSMIDGPVTEALPASALQRHPDVTIVCDEAAASLLKRW
jgi:glucosamine-6-phosphate deaminase